MNPYGDADLNSGLHEVVAQDFQTPPPHSAPGLQDNPHNTSFSSRPPPVIQTGHSSVMVPIRPPYQASLDPDGGLQPDLDRSILPLPGSDLAPSLRPAPPSDVAPASLQDWNPHTESVPAPNPYAASVPEHALQPSSVVVPSPLQSQCLEDSCPDLECSICFSEFNNVFRCPKMLHCKHTFCLECLARMNVKSMEPSAIQCPLCRSFTPLPTLGLPKLTTDADVLSYLPAAMQRVYSIRFLRNKGKLEVKRSSEGQRSLASLRSTNRSLDVGLPSPTTGDANGETRGVGGTLFRLTGRPACRAFLLTSVVMMMILLTSIIITLIAMSKKGQ